MAQDRPPMALRDEAQPPSSRRRNAIVWFKSQSPELTSTMQSATLPPSTMRPAHTFDRKVEEMKPSKSDINWVIMDYLVSEGYPGAAEKFAQETNLCSPEDVDSIRERVNIRNSIHAGRLADAIQMINEIDTQILDHNRALHWSLLQLQLIEIIRPILKKYARTNPPSSEWVPVLHFATEQLAPQAPTHQDYQTALNNTMALTIFSEDKMPAETKQLLDLRLRETVAIRVNKAILESRGQRSEAKIRQLVRARAWAEAQAREAKVDLPAFPIPIGLEPASEAMVS